MSGYFIGIVEDVNDPIQANRIKVRAFGYHNENKDILPTENLPWAMVVIPPTQSGIPDSHEGGEEKFDGITTSLGIMVGNYVCGFFQDPDQQIPIILGSVPGFTNVQDEDEDQEVKVHDIPLAARDELDSDEIPSYQKSASYKYRVESRETGVTTAEDLNPKRDKDEELKSTLRAEVTPSEAGSWDHPDPADTNKPVYPLNHVQRTQSGHVIEYDDSPDAERIAYTHKSGTYHEIQARRRGEEEFGDAATVINGNNYTVIVDNNNVYVKGNMNLTVDGSMKVHVKEDYHLHVDGDYHENIKGNNLKYVKGNINQTIDMDVTEIIKGSKDEAIQGNLTEKYDGFKVEKVGKSVTETYGGGQTTDSGPFIKATACRIDLN